MSALVGIFAGAWTVLALLDARIPAGTGYIDGHYYGKSRDDVLWSLTATAGLAAMTAFLLTYAVSQWYRVAVGRRFTARVFIVVCAVVAFSVIAIAFATPREFCAPILCQETSG